MKPFTLEDFVRESNRIEGIDRDPTDEEILAHADLMSRDGISVGDMERFVAIVQPGSVLRNRVGLNVRVGDHIAPSGGAHIQAKLHKILRGPSPYHVHIEYEILHPFTDGNGRSGRAIWLKLMGGIHRAPLGFLHHFYYQTLQNS